MITSNFIDQISLAFWSPGPAEMMVLAVVALLLYGGNLPEVARSWGKSFAEFRKGLSGFHNELNEVIYSEPDKLEYHGGDSYGERGRDDSRLVNGYEEYDGYLEDTELEETAEDRQVKPDTSDVSDSEVDSEVDASEQTVKDASADTVVIEPNEQKPSAQ